MRQRLGAHAHLYPGGQAGLAAVNARHAVLGQPVAPGAVGQYHRLGHNQVQRRAALAGGDGDLLVAHGLLTTWAIEFEVVVRSIEGFWFAACHFTLRFEIFSQFMKVNKL